MQRHAEADGLLLGARAVGEHLRKVAREVARSGRVHAEHAHVHRGVDCVLGDVRLVSAQHRLEREQDAARRADTRCVLARQQAARRGHQGVGGLELTRTPVAQQRVRDRDRLGHQRARQIVQALREAVGHAREAQRGEAVGKKRDPDGQRQRPDKER